MIKPNHREGDRVKAFDCPLPGIVKAVYQLRVPSSECPSSTRNPEPETRNYYRVQFALGSPYFDDWTVYRERELIAWPRHRPVSQPQPKPTTTTTT